MLAPGDYVIMQSPGNLCGFRLHWEGPYHFDGWTGPTDNPVAILRDDDGQIWHRRNVEVLSYHPREDFIQKYITPLQISQGASMETSQVAASTPNASDEMQDQDQLTSNHDRASSPEIVLEFDSMCPEKFPDFNTGQEDKENLEELDDIRRSSRRKASNIKH